MTSTLDKGIPKSTHLKYLKHCIELARQSPPKPTNFRVGCVIISYPATTTTVTTTETTREETLSTGYTLELQGNTHAEQCALSKLAVKHSVSEDQLGQVLRPELHTILYTSLEPCGKRLSGNLPCVQRIIATTTANTGSGVCKVIFGAKEPGTFVQNSKSCELLTEAGIAWEYIPDLEEEILQVAMEGHHKDQTNIADSTPVSEQQNNTASRGTNIDNISEEERQRQAALPKNPKKRMMETLPRNTDNQKNSS